MVSLSKIQNAGIHYKEASKYPVMDVDLTFLSDTYRPIREAVSRLNCPWIQKTSVVDVYEDGAEKSITIRLNFVCYERTLTREEVQGVTDSLIADLAKEGIPLKL